MLWLRATALGQDATPVRWSQPPRARRTPKAGKAGSLTVTRVRDRLRSAYSAFWAPTSGSTGPTDGWQTGGEVLAGASQAVEAVIARNEHGRYAVPLESLHRPVAQRVISGAVHERETVMFVASCAAGRTVVHAGTYFGDFLPWLSQSARTVFAFEPNPVNHDCARTTVWLNSLGNVRLVNAGLSAQAGWMSMLVRDEVGRALGGASSLVASSPQGVRPGGVVDVRVVALDEALDPDDPVAVIHLDVEGHEQQVLQGALRIIDRWRPTLVLESLPDSGWLDRYLPDYNAAGRVDRNTVLTTAT